MQPWSEQDPENLKEYKKWNFSLTAIIFPEPLLTIVAKRYFDVSIQLKNTFAVSSVLLHSTNR